MTRKTWWALSAAVAAAAVLGVAGVGIATQRSGLDHAPAYTLDAPAPLMVQLDPPEPIDSAALAEELRAQITPALATFGAQITDTTTGEVIFAQDADSALLPASATKLLTASAAFLELGQGDRITTAVWRDPAEPGVVTLKAAGDVWLSNEQLDALANEIAATGPVDTVRIDTSVWTGTTFAPGWDPVDIDGGFIAPMEPAMLYGARLGGTTGELPRSHSPAADVVAALAQRLGATPGGEGRASGEPIAQTQSPTLVERISAMMDESDNVMAEAIGREIALARGLSSDEAPRAVLDVLSEHGLPTAGITLTDTSGLSVDNRIPPAAFNAVLADAVTGTQLRPLIATLPVAGGSGTLIDRYTGLSGAGWVRAKTGTLTGVSALAGIVPAESGHIYSFAMISNGSDILAARAALDELASTLRSSGGA